VWIILAWQWSGGAIILFSLEHIINLASNKKAIVGFLAGEYEKKADTLQYEEV